MMNVPPPQPFSFLENSSGKSRSWILLAILTYSISMLCGCVSLPRDIEPTTVPGVEFSHMDCAQIRHEQYQTNLALIDLMEQQMELRRSQTLHPLWATTANVVFELSLTKVVGPLWLIYPILVNQFNHDSEIARLKGKLQALQRIAMEKGCAEPSL